VKRFKEEAMKELVTHIEIDAPAEKVWETLMDFRDYPQWNPFVQYLLGPAQVGRPLHALLAVPGEEPKVVHPEVVKVEPNRELRWTRKLWFSGILHGEHFFQVRPLTQDRALFIHGEIFSGLLVPFLKRVLEGPTKQSFQAMNIALKRRLES